MYAAGMFEGKDKNWMVEQIVNKLGTASFAVIGDRYQDIEAAKSNNGIAIGCAYGFGLDEVKKADIIISDFTELLEIFK